MRVRVSEERFRIVFCDNFVCFYVDRKKRFYSVAAYNRFRVRESFARSSDGALAVIARERAENEKYDGHHIVRAVVPDPGRRRFQPPADQGHQRTVVPGAVVAIVPVGPLDDGSLPVRRDTTAGRDAAAAAAAIFPVVVQAAARVFHFPIVRNQALVQFFVVRVHFVFVTASPVSVCLANRRNFFFFPKPLPRLLFSLWQNVSLVFLGTGVSWRRYRDGGGLGYT